MEEENTESNQTLKDNSDNICALCQWTTHVNFRYFCGHPNQPNVKLSNGTIYNDTCDLFQEREDFYDKYKE